MPHVRPLAVLSAAAPLLWLAACSDPSCPAGAERTGSACRPLDVGASAVDTMDAAKDGSLKDASADAFPNADGDMKVDGDGDVNEDAQTDAVVPSACEPACSRELAQCSPEGACEPCSEDAHCAAFPDAPTCFDGVCVGCRENRDCTSPEASVCNLSTHTCQPCASDPSPAASDADCAHLADTAVCLAGTCVQCTGQRRAACEQNVCNVLTHACQPGVAPRSAQDCQNCVSDLQCQEGQRCVQRAWDADDDGTNETDLGWFCHWVKGGGQPPRSCNSASRPYAGEEAVTSIDAPGTAVTICKLSASTCPAKQAFRTPCGRAQLDGGSLLVEDRFLKADGGVLDPPLPVSAIQPDDSVCGPRGFCVPKNADGAYQCTMSCGGLQDCPTTIVSTCGGTPPGEIGRCSL